MQNAIKNLINLLSSEYASQKTPASIATEISPDCFTLKTKRAAFFASVVLLMFLSLSVVGGEAKAASFAVNMSTDAIDINIGNGICDSDTVNSGNQCTLRAAIQEANALAGADDITFSLPVPSTVDLTLGELLITGSVNIIGTGARGLSVERAPGAPNFRIFKITAPNSFVVISGITVTNGNLGANEGSGAGFFNDFQSSLSLTGVTVRNNTTAGLGGGIFNFGTLNVKRSTIANNTALQGGGVNNNSSNNGSANISNTTISGNTATNGGVAGELGIGGGIHNYASITLTNVTISGNTATNESGGIQHSSNKTFNIRNTIIAGNTNSSAPDAGGAVVTSEGNNLIGNSKGSTSFTNGVNGDKVGTDAAPLDAKLGALQSNGGQTDTHALLAGSPAIDAGNNCVSETMAPAGCLLGPLLTDQRGENFERKSDGDNNGTATVDIGAFEVQTQLTAADSVVNITTDQHDATLDSICDVDIATAGSQCSLRAAIEEANFTATDNRIFFNLPANSVITLTTANGSEIAINNNGTLEIIGTGANNLTIDGGAGANRIFYINNATAIISGVTLTGGNGLGAFNNTGGAIIAEFGALTLDRVHVTGNTSTGFGAAVSFQNGTHRIVNSTFSANTNNGSCSGIYNNTAALVIVNSTISGNSTANFGGGFCSLGSGSTTFRNSTIANNTGGTGGGGISTTGGTINLGNTIVAANSTGTNTTPEIRYGGGTITSAGGNLVGDSANESTNTGVNAISYQPTDKQNINPMLGAL